jgi:hypothetical protein
VAQVAPVVAVRARGEIRDPDGVAETGPAQGALVGAAVQQHLERVGVAMLGEVKAERLEARAVGALRGHHVDDLEPVPGRAPGDPGEAHRQARVARGAAEAAGLDREPLAAQDEPGRQLVAAEGGRPGNEPPAATEDRHVPVTRRAKPRAHDRTRRRLHPDHVAARVRRRDVAVARPRDGARGADCLRLGGGRCGEKKWNQERAGCGAKATVHLRRP